MKKHLLKIGVAACVAIVLVFLGFKAQKAFGQAAVAYPQPVAGYTIQPVLLTNVSVATVFTPAMVLAAQTATNIPTGIAVGDSNAIVTVSNPFGSQLAGAGAVKSNYVSVAGSVSNLTVWITLGNPNTNVLNIPQSFLKAKVESFQ